MNDKNNKGFFGHPLGLLNLFSTEFCERFSYYGMRAILVYYIYATVASGGLGLTKTDAMYIMSLFGGSVYLLSIIGGWVADRIIGSFKAVFIGGVVIALGHIVLGLPFSGLAGTFIALALIAIGTGFLKPNVSQMVGDLYDEADRRRLSGFNLFVMGINTGAFISPLVIGYVADQTTYHTAFFIPAAFMVIGLSVYAGLSKKTLHGVGKSVANPLSAEEKSKFLKVIALGVVAVVAIVVILNALNALSLESFSIVLPVTCLSIVAILFATMIGDKTLSKTSRDRTIVYLAVYAVATVFWAVQELQASVFAVLIESRTDSTIAGVDVPDAWLQSINPLVIILVTPLLAILWQKWKKQPGAFVKMIFAMLLTGLSYVVPAIAFSMAGEGEMVNPLVLALPIIIFSLAECFISPVALSLTTQLADRKYQSRVMAIYFMSNTLGQGINSFCIRFFDEDNPSGFFYGYAVAAFLACALIVILIKPLIKRSHGAG
jgi:POT family proton-dependent oligopeptide transporter